MTILLASQRVRLYDSKELDDVLQAMARKAATRYSGDKYGVSIRWTRDE
ncbi:hypothetical protein [Pseudomonas fluorescens]